jgi:hypothetical protein
VKAIGGDDGSALAHPAVYLHAMKIEAFWNMIDRAAD